MFIHQDVFLLSKKWLEKAEKLLSSLTNLAVAGVASKRLDSGHILSAIRHSIPPKKVRIQFSRPVRVQSLDEVLLIVLRHVFSRIGFDDRTCNGWHLYGVDYCLKLRKLGLHIYVILLRIYHLSTVIKLNPLHILRSPSILPREYRHSLNNLLSKYRGYYIHIPTTIDD